MTAKTCRHCDYPKVNRPRGLCWNCYYTPGVKEQYPSTSIYARRGVGAGFRLNAPLPAAKTDALPGTEEKIEVLAGRAARGETLWHPGDPYQSPGRSSCEPRDLKLTGAECWLIDSPGFDPVTVLDLVLYPYVTDGDWS